MIVDILWILAGLVLLVGGSEYLVRGSASIAMKLRVSELVIGLTIVSIGTSAPEMTVNLVAAMRGSAEIAVGNVLGSNIVNILLVLGICAVITTLKVSASTVWKEIPFALMAMILLIIMSNDVILDGAATNVLTRTDGLALMALMIVFMYYVINMAMGDRKSSSTESVDTPHNYSILASILMITAGLIALVGGGQLLVSGASSLAIGAGVSESLIGLTIVAVGTSLPELVTSVVAARRGHADIAVGNIVGSNVFNALWVLGLTSVITPIPIANHTNYDLLVGIGATVALFAYMFMGARHRISRSQGVVFIALYVLYMASIIVRG